MRINFSAFGYYFGISIDWKRIKTDVMGYTNRCIDGKYIITLDYDGLELIWIEQELKAIQEMFKLGDFYIFKSNKGFHAVCLDKVTLNDYLHIVRNTSVDENYINVPLRYGKKLWTLRFTPKDEKEVIFKRIIKSKYEGLKQKSLAHANAISSIFNMYINKTLNYDDETILTTARYRI